ncbi:MAG TPA: nicotinate-nucleotide adenylyltransferase [Casimicrobiaceae bacterium]|nr:nicotinate-nucleotide adenylyltransferase [Casimicrobiaceae bacterium]
MASPATDMTPPVAILGGTFDPVHYGHLRLADEVRRALGLAQIRLVPAGDPPHRGGPRASAADRLAMLRLAASEFPALAVDPREIERGGKSYTVLTLEELRREAPRRPLLLVVGADAFLGFPTWHRWRRIFDLAHVVVVARPGVALAGSLPPELLAQWQARLTTDRSVLFSQPSGAIYEQPITPQPISATEIRTQLARGAGGRSEVVRLLPPAVLAYIDQHRLYSA